MEMDERIILKDTPEKYAEMAKEIVPPFLKLMEEIVDLENSASKRLGEMEAEKVRYGFGDKDKWLISSI